ncbi:MAG: spore cortex biosynthesis protein YabQ [Clostridia bacterium]|nr:spore cortex biosynthesis protein YabQ [Clostridia bacterium]
MELTLRQQTEAFLWSFVLGIIVALIYTVISVIRVISPPSKIQLFVGDVLFMVFSALLNFLFAVAFTEGNLRFYTIFAELISFFAIHLTLGRVAKKTAHIIFRFISAILRKISYPVIKLINAFLSFLREKCSVMLKKAKKIKKVRFFPLHCRYKMLYNVNDKSSER